MNQYQKQDTIGLLAIVLFNHSPFFFLFAEIDTHNSQQLTKVLRFYQRNHLSVYYHKTVHGYHFFSPCLLKFRQWLRLTAMLRPTVKDYRFDCLRISYRYGDSSELEYCSWNKKHKESQDLHALLLDRFKINDWSKIVKGQSTQLQFVEYKQLIRDSN